jgi:hypothetical protein
LTAGLDFAADRIAAFPVTYLKTVANSRIDTHRNDTCGKNPNKNEAILNTLSYLDHQTPS